MNVGYCLHLLTKRVFSSSSASIKGQIEPLYHSGRAKIWIDNLSTSNLFLRYRPDLLQYFQLLNPAHPETKQQLISNAIRDFIPDQLTLHGFQVLNVIPRLKDRGVLIEFLYRAPQTRSSDDILNDILFAIRKHLGHDENAASSGWLQFFYRIRAFLVKGEPFVEDISNKTASSKIRIEFQGGADPPIEELYKNLRPYGRLVDLTYPSPSTKDLPRFAIAQFRNIASAASAKNCLHGVELNGTRLNLSYEKIIQTNVLRKWILDHPRISLPLGAALFIGIPAAMFDPIRIYSIRTTITRSLSIPFDTGFTNLPIFSTITEKLLEWWDRVLERMQTIRPFVTSQRRNLAWPGEPEGINVARSKISNWLDEKPETFMLVIGPKGSGKSYLVNSISSEKQLMELTISCHELAGKNEREVINRLAAQVGYFPILSMFDSLTTIADNAVQAATGQKTGLPTNFDSRIKQILELTTRVITDLVVKQQKQVGEDGPLESEAVKYPLIVIEGFMNNDRVLISPHMQKVFEALANWGSYLAQSGLAHVIFVSTCVGTWAHGANQVLSKELTQRTFETVHFSDPSPPNALRFLIQRLDGKNIADKEIALTQAIEKIGCRLSDLELLVAKVQTGMPVDEAVNDLLLRSIVELRKHGLVEEFSGYTDGLKKRAWTRVQFWQILKELEASEKGQISFDLVKNGPLFGGDDSALYAMEKSELICIVYQKGHPQMITPGRPIYRSAFREIVHSPSSSVADLNMQMYKAMIDVTTAKIKSLESELKDLGGILSDASKDWHVGRLNGKKWMPWLGDTKDCKKALALRFMFLSNQIADYQQKITTWQNAYLVEADTLKQLARNETS